MKKNENHIKIRDEIELLLENKYSIEDISKIINLPLGSRYIKNTTKWYIYCIRAKQNQKRAIEKHPNLYSLAEKIAQQKNPEIGYKLGKKYGPIWGKINALKKDSEHFSKMAKRLQKINPEHSKNNMKKAHKTMKKNGTFYNHQRKSALECMKKHPNQLKEMSKKAHSLYPLGLLALESRRKNYPYKFMNCLFDSDGERKLCKIFTKNNLIDKPKERENIHFRINRNHIDFFIRRKVFVEYHPMLNWNNKKETIMEYYNRRRSILDSNGYKNYPLIVIDRLRNIEPKIDKIKKLLAIKL